MYDFYHCGTESESVVQRNIERSIDVHVCCPQCKARQLVIHNSRIWHDFGQNHVFTEKRVALYCVFCDGRAKAVLEEDIFVIFHAIQT